MVLIVLVSFTLSDSKNCYYYDYYSVIGWLKLFFKVIITMNCMLVRINVGRV